jgi:hypothetical protein
MWPHPKKVREREREREQQEEEWILHVNPSFILVKINSFTLAPNAMETY